jgi:1-acyl-sn-glycerol-3-phosphate acyltransferase
MSFKNKDFMETIYKNIRAAFRFIMFIFVIISYLFISGVFSILTLNPIKRRRHQIQMTSWTCRMIMTAFNIKLICKNPIDAAENSLLVGNHLGFIDIVCLQSIQPAVFITSLEMKKTPVLGQICDLGGCAYVNRQNRMGIQDELKGMVDVLKQGFRVVLYAESVASNGEQVLPFKKTLMMSAGFADRPIRPFVFNYRQVNNGEIEYKHRDSVCWYGDQTFGPAIWRSLLLDSVTCEIEFLPLVYIKPDDNRSAVANQIHKMVSEKFSPFVSDGSSLEQNHFVHST